MRTVIKTILTIFFLAITLLFMGTMPAESVASTRHPRWTGMFYPNDPSDLKQLIERLTRKAKKTKISLPMAKRLKALILPHAGYIYSGWTAAHASIVLKPDDFKRIILIGPDHRVGFSGGAVTPHQAWNTPLGTVPISREAGRLCSRSELFTRVPMSDKNEHSLEVIVPFLQVYLNEFQLLPIVFGRCDTNRAASIIGPLLDESALLVASSDLSHYLPYERAVLRDNDTLSHILQLDEKSVLDEDNRACGKIPIMIVNQLAREKNWQPVLLHYSNSGDTAGDRSAVVGYAAVAFFERTKMNKTDQGKPLSHEQGMALVMLARQTLLEEFGRSLDKNTLKKLEAALNERWLTQKSGTFVTLKINHDLRGCIGSLDASEPLVSGVKKNARHAAFRDPRFSRLSEKELDKITIEVSVLTEPEELSYQDADDLVDRLRPGIDGVILKKGYASATFLPQVWDQLPNAQTFLSHLCAKAGLSSGEWKKGKLEILTYQVQYFEEEN